MDKYKLLKHFEEKAKIKNEILQKAGLTCICGKCNLAQFSLNEIKEIIEIVENANDN